MLSKINGHHCNKIQMGNANLKISNTKGIVLYPVVSVKDQKLNYITYYEQH